jgi:alkanesulfonate monooxygenase SsuD/methylene tetrahydromethanopterin reductase-like flavin-dependent oxidoreductase (luciferase family)
VQNPLPLWIGGSSDAAIRRTARIGTGWLAGIQTPAQVAPVVARIAKEARAAGRPIDADHYGAGFAYRFGSWSDPVADRAAAGMKRFAPHLDARAYLAVGGAPEIEQRLDEYRAAGVSKFVMRPLATDDRDFMEQTRRLIEEVLPRAHAG